MRSMLQCLNPAKGGGRYTQAVVSDHQVVVHFETDVSDSLITRFQDAIPKFIGDHKVVNLIARAMSVI